MHCILSRRNTLQRICLLEGGGRDSGLEETTRGTHLQTPFYMEYEMLKKPTVERTRRESMSSRITNFQLKKKCEGNDGDIKDNLNFRFGNK